MELGLERDQGPSPSGVDCTGHLSTALKANTNVVKE
jgi:hypothetical protein